MRLFISLFSSQQNSKQHPQLLLTERHRFWFGQKAAQAKTLLEGELNTVEKEAGLIHSSDLGSN